MVRGERDRTQRDLRSRCCYLPVALTKARGTPNPTNSLLSHALIRLREADLAQHDENCGTKSSKPLLSTGESHGRIKATAYFSSGCAWRDRSACGAGRRQPAPPRHVRMLSHPIGGRGRETGPFAQGPKAVDRPLQSTEDLAATSERAHLRRQNTDRREPQQKEFVTIAQFASVLGNNFGFRVAGTITP